MCRIESFFKRFISSATINLIIKCGHVVQLQNVPIETSRNALLPFQFQVLGTKIEIKLAKASGIRWPELEGDGADPLKPAGAAAASSSSTTTVKPSYPSSSGKDWNAIGAAIEKEYEEDKKEGEAALNDMFQKIYMEGNDDLKKAMNKSFSESGGTVLSTNWGDIKKDKVDCKPPEGMEFKKWDA